MKFNMEQRTVVLLCPCCASPVDAIAGAQEQSLTCEVCDQSWRMVVDSARIAEYALT
jgi:uncharacterized protein YbaR (Trm112 family)